MRFLARTFARCLSVFGRRVLIWVALDRFLRPLREEEESRPPVPKYPRIAESTGPRYVDLIDVG